MRNANGFGTVYKKSDNLRKPYRAAIPIGRGEKGQVLYKTIGYFKHRHEGIAALTDYHNGHFARPVDITLLQLYEEWSAAKYKHITKSTVETYKAAWLHLDSIKTIRYQEIRTAHYQKIIDSLKMSRSTLHKIKTLAVQLNDYAVQNDISNKNYATYIKLPKWKKSEREIFTDAEIKKLFKCEHEWADSVLILIYTGMRINEACQLTFFQIQDGVIHTGSKTDAGERVIPISKKIAPIIEKYKRLNQNYLFEVDGKPLSPDSYRRRKYYPALDEAKVRKLSPHCCRHTFASILARNKVDTLSIQKLMGHADYSLTANVYSHPEIKQLKTAVDTL